MNVRNKTNEKEDNQRTLWRIIINSGSDDSFGHIFDNFIRKILLLCD